MADIPPEDLKLIQDLEDLKNTLTRLQLAFTKRQKTGCACNGPLEMCAHHAQVFAQLDAAGDRLLFAQAQLRREN